MSSSVMLRQVLGSESTVLSTMRCSLLPGASRALSQATAETSYGYKTSLSAYSARRGSIGRENAAGSARATHAPWTTSSRTFFRARAVVKTGASAVESGSNDKRDATNFIAPSRAAEAAESRVDVAKTVGETGEICPRDLPPLAAPRDLHRRSTCRLRVLEISTTHSRKRPPPHSQFCSTSGA